MRIIIIEDEWAIATDYERALKSAFSDVECVLLPDAQKAAQTHQELSADLIITDLIMDSKHEGAYGVHSIRQFDPDVPILIISGHPKMAEFADPFSTSKFLVKPVDTTILVSTVSKMLNVQPLKTIS